MSAKSKKLSPAVMIIPLLSLTFLGTGCQHIGPGTIVDDRLGYNRKILTSWEEQTLLNIVRVRYDDLVGFVDVTSVTQTHTRQDSISGSIMASLLPWHIHKDTISPSVTGGQMVTDSPAITYSPLIGSDFTRNLNAPLKPGDIFNLIESGYNADVFLNLTLYSINGIPSVKPDVNLNDRHSRASTNSQFRSLTRAIESAHSAGKVSFYVKPATDTEEGKVLMNLEGADDGSVATIRQILHLRPAATQFEIVTGFRPLKEDQIAVQTKSAIAAIRWLALYVDVPPSDISKFGIKCNLAHGGDDPIWIESTPNKPTDTFATVQYNHSWFSICNRDHNSKFSLIYLRTLLAYADTGQKLPPPVLAIPTR
jgi:hypothetical protein